MGTLKQRFKSKNADECGYADAGGAASKKIVFKRQKIAGKKVWWTHQQGRLSLFLLVSMGIFALCVLLQRHRRSPIGFIGRGDKKSRRHGLIYWDSNKNIFIHRLILVPDPIIGNTVAGSSSSMHRLNYYDENFSDGEDDGIDYSDMDSRTVFSDDEWKDCHPQAPWQTASYETCNTLHEILLSEQDERMQFINCGSGRCTFRVDDVVLKTVKFYNASFALYSRMTAKKDNLALEHLTSSPYVMDIYASCGVAKVVEYSSQGNLHDVIKESRLQEKIKDEVRVHPRGKPWEEEDGDQHTIPAEYRRHQYTTPIQKLKIAYQLLTAVADMHGLEELDSFGDEMPLMLHNDLCCHQYLLVDGIYKLGDMDTVTFVTAQESQSSRGKPGLRVPVGGKQKVCQTTPLVWDFSSLKVLAPEELIYYDDNATRIAVARDKIDVYKIGSTVYTVLTNWWEWEGYHTRPASIKKFMGELPPFPEDDVSMFSEGDQAALKALKEAVMMAWTPNPNERPSARRISKYLLEQIQSIDSESDHDKHGAVTRQDERMAVRVSLRPLPPNHRYTDSDFMARWPTGSDF